MTETTTATDHDLAHASNPVLTKVAALFAPIIADLGLDLYDLEFAGGTLRVTIDTPPGQDSGVSLDTIALATRLFGRELDHADPVPGRYTLEVTSPGLERNLRKPAHFERELGKEIAVRLVSAVDGRRRIQGILVRADDKSATIRLNDDQSEFSFGFDQVERAKTVFIWGPAPKPGKESTSKKKKKTESNEEETKS